MYIILNKRKNQIELHTSQNLLEVKFHSYAYHPRWCGLSSRRADLHVRYRYKFFLSWRLYLYVVYGQYPVCKGYSWCVASVASIFFIFACYEVISNFCRINIYIKHTKGISARCFLTIPCNYYQAVFLEMLHLLQIMYARELKLYFSRVSSTLFGACVCHFELTKIEQLVFRLALMKL